MIGFFVGHFIADFTGRPPRLQIEQIDRIDSSTIEGSLRRARDRGWDEGTREGEEDGVHCMQETRHRANDTCTS